MCRRRRSSNSVGVLRLLIEPTDQWHQENGMLFRLWRTVGPNPITIYVAGCSVPVAHADDAIAVQVIELCSPAGTTATRAPE